MTLAPACWRRRAEDRCGATPRGNPGVDVPSVWCSSAHSQHRVRSSCRGGGGNITGFDFMWAIGRVQCAVSHDGWCRRLRRGRRAKRESGQCELRFVQPVIRSSSVPSSSGWHAVPQRAWQHVRRAGSPRRGWTSSAMIRVRSRAPGRPFGVSVVHRRELSVLRCDANRHASFRRYPESLVWQGRWGSRRGGNATVGFQPNPTSSGRFRIGSKAMTSSLALTSWRRRRATADDVGVSNR
jgi:hypothetical protein